MTTEKVKSLWPNDSAVPSHQPQPQQSDDYQVAVQDTPASTVPDLPKTGVDFVAPFLRAGDAILNDLRKRLLDLESNHRETASRMQLDHNRAMRDLDMAHEKEVAAIKSEIGVMSARLGFSS